VVIVVVVVEGTTVKIEMLYVLWICTFAKIRKSFDIMGGE
jgi:hypothetical protein